MRLSLILPQVVVAFCGVLITVGVQSHQWGTALVAALAAAVFTGAAAAWAISPLLDRIGSHASNVSFAAHRTSTPALVSGEDELEAADRTFQELSARWEDQNAALARDARTLTAVLDGMGEGIWVTDADGTLVRHNQALAKMVQPGRPMLGQRPLSIIRSNELNDAVTRACRQGESSRLEVVVEGPRPRILDVQVIPLGHDLPGSAAVFHEVTELRRLEKVRKDFVANVSHELGTPITAIRGYAETLRSGALNDPEHAPKMVEIIHRQSERLSALVADLLELSRLESGTQKLTIQDLVLDEVLNRAADAARPRAEAKNIALSLEVSPALRARADARSLEQVLVNLLINAVKYTPNDGHVTVTGGVDGGRAWLAVEDDGPGIEPKHLGRLFERFYRIDRGRSRDTGGTGLGLAIVKHLVGAMGGEVQVTSHPGEGSRFTIFLPATAQLPPMTG